VVVGRSLDQPERDLALTVDKRVPLDGSVGGRVPHKDRRTRERACGARMLRNRLWRMIQLSPVWTSTPFL
jgi:hypothetical protein